jgi:hypothetical protein
MESRVEHARLISVLFRFCFGSVLVLFWFCFGSVLARAVITRFGRAFLFGYVMCIQEPVAEFRRLLPLFSLRAFCARAFSRSSASHLACNVFTATNVTIIPHISRFVHHNCIAATWEPSGQSKLYVRRCALSAS